MRKQISLFPLLLVCLCALSVIGKPSDDQIK